MSPAPLVLVVDDNAVNAAVAAAHLRRVGWSAQTASDGAQALRLLDDTACDLVLLDISMPGMSGIELCRLLRERPRHRGTPIVAYTAHALREEHDALRSAGFDAILTKPVDRAAIEAVLARLGLQDAAAGVRTPAARSPAGAIRAGDQSTG